MGLSYQERAAQVMEHLVGHDGDAPGHGYSQPGRWGDGDREEIVLSDGTTTQVVTGDRDCSSAVIDAWEAVLPGSTGGATYTGDMRECFVSTGLWAWHPAGDGYVARRGDVYLNEAHHTAMCKSTEPRALMQFSLSETGSIDGVVGDQTGGESNIRAFYDYPWDGVLAYVGSQPGGVDSGRAAGEGDEGPRIRALQGLLSIELHCRGLEEIAADGIAGQETQRGVVRLLQDVHNGTWGEGLSVDGIIGPQTCASMARHPVGLAQGCEREGDDVWCIEMGLVIQGFAADLMKRTWDEGDQRALQAHQERHGLAPDGICGSDTLPTLLPLACV